MADVRAKNTGTFDHTTNTWRIKAKRIQASLRQLSKRYGVTLTGEKDSAPYWRRYLQDIEDGHQQARKAVSPLQERIRSIEAMIHRLRDERGDTAILERMLREAINTGPGDIDAADIPVVHPAAEEAARQLDIDPGDEYSRSILHNLIPLPPPQPAALDSIKHEAEVYIERHKAKGHKGWFEVRQVLNIFTSITGDISIRDVTVHHYRHAHNKITNHPTWNGNTKPRRLHTLNTWLKRIEADHGVNYSFLRNSIYRMSIPDGNKEQYTLEQVKTALQHATGDVRMALLLGLNTGAYWGDIVRFKPDMVKDNHLSFIRAKNRHKTSPVKGCFLLWPETVKLLRFDNLNGRKLQEAYTAFAKLHQLPSHKALRKTTTQVIEDKLKDERAARLFRAEKLDGNHGRSYVQNFTPDQVETLDNALRAVGKIYGL